MIPLAVRRVEAICVALVLSSGAPAAAQTMTGTLQGTVTDTSGGVLPEVTGSLTAEIGAAYNYAPRTLQLVLRYRY